MITVLDYDPTWPARFEALRREYAEALAHAGVPVVGIEHVGSTSVPGLAAKPFIDCDIIVAQQDVEAATAVLVSLGFMPLGELGIPLRRAFKEPSRLAGTNTYVIVDGSLALRNHLAVRDHLRADALLRDTYGAVKKRAGASAADIYEYGRGKNDTIQQILAAAGLTPGELASINANQVPPGPAATLRPKTVAERGRGWYRGDCHVHSTYSDGELTPEQLASAARAAGLDFVATTEHNSSAAHSDWAEQAGDDLLVILGEEVTTPTGHWLALGIPAGHVVDWRYRTGDALLERQLEQVHRAGGLCVAAHPHAPYQSGDFMYPFTGFDLVEVWNGRWTSDQPWNADNESALAEWGRALAADVRRGWWRPAMGNSDTHLADQIGTAQTVVLAESLSTDAILSGLQAGRSWIAESSEIRLSLKATAGDRQAGIGDRLSTNGGPAVVQVEVGGVSSGTVSFHTEQGKVHRVAFSGGESNAIEWSTTAQESRFVRIEVRHAVRRMAALTNPIILT